MTKEEFLQLPTESNDQFVTERILSDFTPKQIDTMIAIFQQLDKSLYKSWAKDMPFTAIKNALEYAGELTNPKSIQEEETDPKIQAAQDILRKAVPAKDIAQIKAAYELFDWIEDAKLVTEAKRLINNQINIELTKAVLSNDYKAFVEAWELLEYENGDEKTDDLLNKALDIFISSAKIELRTLPDEKVIKEYPFADRVTASREYDKMTAGHAFDAYDFIVKYPEMEAQYLYMLILTDIHGKQFTTRQLGSLTGPEHS